MLYEIMMHLNNFFPTKIREDALYKIEDGTLTLPFVLDGQYILIEGSNFNDGVYIAPLSDLIDETFEGTVTILNPPKEFLKLVSDIQEFEKTSTVGIYESESFGGYSYQRAVNANGGIACWKDAYRGQLNTWRKV